MLKSPIFTSSLNNPNMKRLILITALLFIVSCQQESKMDPNINPFFQEWNTPYEVPPFLDIKDEHYMPAYEQGMKENLEEIDAIVNNPSYIFTSFTKINTMLSFIIGTGVVILFIWLIINRVDQTDKEKFDKRKN